MEKEIQYMPVYQPGGEAMVKIKIIVHIAGEEIDWDKIPEEKRRIISEKIQETMMSSAGYKRAPV